MVFKLYLRSKASNKEGIYITGEFAARKLKRDRKRYKWKQIKYRNRILKLKKKKDT